MYLSDVNIITKCINENNTRPHQTVTRWYNIVESVNIVHTLVLSTNKKIHNKNTQGHVTQCYNSQNTIAITVSKPLTMPKKVSIHYWHILSSQRTILTRYNTWHFYSNTYFIIKTSLLKQLSINNLSSMLTVNSAQSVMKIIDTTIRISLLTAAGY